MLVPVSFLFAERLSLARNAHLSPEWKGAPMDNDQIWRLFGFSEIVPGAYLVGPNGKLALRGVTDRDFNRSPEFRAETRLWGVGDSPEQILAHVVGIAPDFPCVLLMTSVSREAETEGGFRWSRYGAYIGTQNPQAEYLKDEPLIETVLTFDTIPVVPDLVEKARLASAPATPL